MSVVCLSVCHKPVLYRNSWTDRGGNVNMQKNERAATAFSASEVTTLWRCTDTFIIIVVVIIIRIRQLLIEFATSFNN